MNLWVGDHVLGPPPVNPRHLGVWAAEGKSLIAN